MHLDISFFVTKMLALNKETRQYLSSINSALLDLFIRSYGLNHKLRRTNLAGTINLIPFLSELEKKMIKSEWLKEQANQAYKKLI